MRGYDTGPADTSLDPVSAVYPELHVVEVGKLLSWTCPAGIATAKKCVCGKVS